MDSEEIEKKIDNIYKSIDLNILILSLRPNNIYTTKIEVKEYINELIKEYNKHNILNFRGKIINLIIKTDKTNTEKEVYDILKDTAMVEKQMMTLNEERETENSKQSPAKTRVTSSSKNSAVTTPANRRKTTPANRRKTI